MKRRIVLIVLTALMTVVSACAQETANEKQARRIFNQVYQKVYGAEGSTFHYQVNIVGVFKTEGTVWMKGAKSMSESSKHRYWDNGRQAWYLDKKKQTVTLYDASSNKKDKQMSRFKFAADDFTYHIQKEASGELLLTLRLKKGAKSTIKEMRAWIDGKTLAPKHLRLKVAFIWTKVQITKFQSGNISDHLFTFPQDQYPDCKVIDKRGE